MAGIDSKIRKADELYHLIDDGDEIAVGLSGGKDSTVLIWALAKLREYCGKDFGITGLTIDPQFGGSPGSYERLTAFCETLGVKHVVKPDNIYNVVFEIRNESNPCSLCARMRRGSLNRTAKELGCNKVALGHHMDDVAATFWMNLRDEGRLGTFSPLTYLDRSDITVIRPMVLCREKEVLRTAEEIMAPVIESGCPVNGKTDRAAVKKIMDDEMSWLGDDPCLRTFEAIQRSGLFGYNTKDNE
ncbi:MAG: tRNA 2-thiocytidine biosynthesis protein TtcA [Oscillospiraceae bacterium]|nr:tRNA 2-thiocytidine biosynthesis protein TtcA [Oscillospiraceae bacterium]